MHVYTSSYFPHFLEAAKSVFVRRRSDAETDGEIKKGKSIAYYSWKKKSFARRKYCAALTQRFPKYLDFFARTFFSPTDRWRIRSFSCPQRLHLCIQGGEYVHQRRRRTEDEAFPWSTGKVKCPRKSEKKSCKLQNLLRRLSRQWETPVSYSELSFPPERIIYHYGKVRRQHGQSPFFCRVDLLFPSFFVGGNHLESHVAMYVGKLLTQEKCLLDGQDIGECGGGCFITNIIILGKTGFLVIIYLPNRIFCDMP